MVLLPMFIRWLCKGCIASPRVILLVLHSESACPTSICGLIIICKVGEGNASRHVGLEHVRLHCTQELLLWAKDAPWSADPIPCNECSRWELVVLHGIQPNESACSSQTSFARTAMAPVSFSAMYRNLLTISWGGTLPSLNSRSTCLMP